MDNKHKNASIVEWNDQSTIVSSAREAKGISVEQNSTSLCSIFIQPNETANAEGKHVSSSSGAHRAGDSCCPAPGPDINRAGGGGGGILAPWPCIPVRTVTSAAHEKVAFPACRFIMTK